MPGKNILVERKDKIGLITLNRPEKRNTFNVPFAKELNSVSKYILYVFFKFILIMNSQ